MILRSKLVAAPLLNPGSTVISSVAQVSHMTSQVQLLKVLQIDSKMRWTAYLALQQVLLKKSDSKNIKNCACTAWSGPGPAQVRCVAYRWPLQVLKVLKIYVKMIQTHRKCARMHFQRCNMLGRKNQTQKISKTMILRSKLVAAPLLNPGSTVISSVAQVSHMTSQVQLLKVLQIDSKMRWTAYLALQQVLLKKSDSKNIKNCACTAWSGPGPAQVRCVAYRWPLQVVKVLKIYFKMIQTHQCIYIFFFKF